MKKIYYKKGMWTCLIIIACLLASGLQTQAQTDEMADLFPVETDSVRLQNSGPVSIAYGTMDRRDITSAVSTVQGEELRKNMTTSLDHALVGRLNGFIGLPWSYETGTASLNKYVRGLKTTSPNNEPLLLIDNFEGDFSQISPEEVESISVLKDAAALALYGSRGANGVILVKTRRGQTGKRVMTINARMGFQESLNLQTYLNSYDYARLYNKAWQMDGNATDFYSPEAIEGYRKTVQGASDANPYLYPNNNFVDEFLNKISYQQNYDITMQGGNDLARYFAFIGYLRQDGMYKYGNVNDDYNTNANYQRVNLRTNIDVNISRHVSAFFDMAGRIELRHYPGSGEDLIFRSLSATPSNAYPIFNEDGSLGGNSTYRNNPYGLISQSGYTDTNRRIFDTYAGFKIDMDEWIKGLSFTAKTGFNFNNYKDRGLEKNFKVYQYNPENDSYIEYGNEDYSTFGNARDNNYYRQFNVQAFLEYARSFNADHNVNAIGLFNLATRSRPGNYPDYKNIAFGLRGQYNYKHRYYAEIVGSYTANEAYLRGNRFGFFPAASLGWVLTEEEFFPQTDALNFLKIRGSYGKTGSDRPYGDDSSYRFLYMDNWTVNDGGYAFGNPQQNFTGAGEVSVGNPHLRWEESTKMNIGLDVEFVKSMLYFSIDYYKDKRSGIWVQRDGWIPSVYGAAAPYENAGKAESKGFELMAGIRQSFGDFKMDIRGMADFGTSKIIDLQEAPKEWDYQYSAGKKIGEVWGLQALGFFQSQEEIDAHATQTFTTTRPGDIKYLDVNEDGVIDNNDAVALGKTYLPKWTFGLNIELAYRNFDLSMLWQGVKDVDTNIPAILGLPFYDNNATAAAFDAWTPENAATAKYPRLTTSDHQNNSVYSTFWQADGSYLRLKTLEIGYTIPNTPLRKAGIERARVFLNGYNLLTICKLDSDPEVPNAGIWGYPATKLYSIGLNLSF